MGETLKLYDCRSCGSLCSANIGECPVCGYNETTEETVGTLGGESDTKQVPWYEVHHVKLK
jgi:predicted ATP-dependent serine protease